MKKNSLFDRISRLAVFVFCLGGFLISNIWVELKPDIVIYKILSIFFLSILLVYLFAEFVYSIIHIKSKNEVQEKTKVLDDDNEVV